MVKIKFSLYAGNKITYFINSLFLKKLGANAAQGMLVLSVFCAYPATAVERSLY